VVLNQKGSGPPPEPAPAGTAAASAKSSLASSALGDIRFNVKTRFLGGKAPMPDRRDFGLGLDLGLSVPSGDERNFAGENGVVFFPTAVLDFHRCKFSAALNVGARLRSDTARIEGT
jgi:hypothetical protein